MRHSSCVGIVDAATALIRRAAWHAYASRDSRDGAQLRPDTVEGAGRQGSPTVYRRLGCVLEVMHAILQAGGDGETIRIVSRIEPPAFLSDKGGRVLLA